MTFDHCGDKRLNTWPCAKETKPITRKSMSKLVIFSQVSEKQAKHTRDGRHVKNLTIRDKRVRLG